MEARVTNLLELMSGPKQFSVPIYQRTYSWTEKQCRQLWEDIIQAGKQAGKDEKDESTHFIGSIVYIESGLYQVTKKKPLLVIDGQQRLTTITLLLAALSAALGENDIADLSKQELREYYLVNQLEKGDRHYKLILSQTDKDTLISIIGNDIDDSKSPPPAEPSIRIEQNYSLFKEWIAAYKSKNNLSVIWAGLNKLSVVDMALDRNNNHDNPQLIFESMNSTGLDLSEADLIRNFILMDLKPEQQEDLYSKYWRPMEKLFGQKAYSKHFDRFMRDYLTVKTGSIPRIGEVYEEFKKYYSEFKSDYRNNVEEAKKRLVNNIYDFAKYYCNIALGNEPDPELEAIFQHLRELNVSVAYPFLLELYQDYTDKKLLTKAELLEAAHLVEAYVFRRAVCEMPTNALNKIFATFAKSLNKERYLETIKVQFARLPSYRSFPDDAKFKEKLKSKDLYNFSNSSYWLYRFENYGRKETVTAGTGKDKITIEHIMPQSDLLPLAWQTALGKNWRDIHNKYLHTLGNLTLTGYNSKYSNKPFEYKRDTERGFRESPLRLNAGLGKVKSWNKKEIELRSARLADEAVKIWRMPDISPETLKRYPEKAKMKSKSQRSDINDYQHHLYAGSPASRLFDKLSEAILNLDSDVVNEEFLKLYVAYKADKNFVDVIPQETQLKLTLNMEFSEIRDPNKMCRDITGIGRHGNGDVQVIFKSLDELPYIMGLIRQSWERQFRNDD